MVSNESHSQRSSIRPIGLVHLLLISGLAALAYAIITQKLLIFAALACIPLALIFFYYSIKHPRFSYLLYITFIFYLTAIMRYSRQDGLSVIGDILLVFISACILIHCINRKEELHISQSVNFLTICYGIWALYILIQFINPANDAESYVIGLRSWILKTTVLGMVSCILLNHPRYLRIGLIIIGLFIFTAFLKLLYQKYRWFDAAETEWLMNGSWFTHILPTGIRYFSIYSDAGSFGANMGMITIAYSIIAFHTRHKWTRRFFWAVSLMGMIGMFMSGTRGAIVVPLGGLALYCLLCKNMKVMVLSAFFLSLVYVFFSFTDIGESNGMIRRMRTAFRPKADASFNVRLDNQQKIAEYMTTHPWGAGLGKGVERIKQSEQGTTVENIPPDSFYVDIWTQTGYSGLVLYIAICAALILYGSYLILFRIQDKELRHTLAGLLCGVFGLWLNGYVGRGMGMPPSDVMVIASLAYIMNGPYMDRLIRDNKVQISSGNKQKTNNI